MPVVYCSLLWVAQHLERLADEFKRLVCAWCTVLGDQTTSATYDTQADSPLILGVLAEAHTHTHTLSGCNDNASFLYAFLICMSSQFFSTDRIS